MSFQISFLDHPNGEPEMTSPGNQTRDRKRSLLQALPLRERPAHRVNYSVEDCNMLELLATLVGGQWQLEIASALIARFGSIRNISRATVHELTSICGIGHARAACLKAALELGQRRMNASEDNGLTIQSPEDAARLLMPRMQDLEQEHLFILLLDTRNRLIGEPVQVYRGSLNSSLVRVAELFRPAIQANAAAILVAHNHPSGDPEPSPEDVGLTRAIVEAGKLLDVECVDHLIIGRGRYVSLKSRGLGFEGST
jgi:DNA repair protein RadC